MKPNLLESIAEAINETLEDNAVLRASLLNLQQHLCCRYVVMAPFEDRNPLTDQYTGFVGHLLGVGEIACQVSPKKIDFVWASAHEFPHQQLFDGRRVTIDDLRVRIDQKGWA